MDKKRTLKSFCNGFTLLEILFVIVIMAGVMVTWVIYTQRGSTQKMVDKTAEQMLQLVEASRGYFSNQLYYWPASFDNLISAGYITKSGQCSSWQKVKNGSSDCSSGTKEAYQLYWSNTTDTSKAKIFGVSIVVSTEEIANQIVAQLPMNKIDPLPPTSPTQWQVFALTTVPAAAADLEGKIIKVGTVMSNQIHNNNADQRQSWKTPSGNADTDAQHGYVKKPNCPDPLQPAIFFTQYDYDLGHAVGGAGSPTLSVDVWCETGVKNPQDTSQFSNGFDSYDPMPAYDPNNDDSGRYCDGTHGGARYPAFSGPQFCDYEPTLNYDSSKSVDYSTYWRLNYWACPNKGFSVSGTGKASLIYFVTCLNPILTDPNNPKSGGFFYPFSPYTQKNETQKYDFNTTPMNATPAGTSPMGNFVNTTTVCLKDQYNLSGKADKKGQDNNYYNQQYYGCYYPVGCPFKAITQAQANGHLTFCPRKRRRCIGPYLNANPLIPTSSSGCPPAINEKIKM